MTESSKLKQQNSASCLSRSCWTNSRPLHVGYPGITLLVQTRTILPQLMFWSTMCRLKALSYMTRQIKADHRIWSTLVGYDSPTWTSQRSRSFPRALGKSDCRIILLCPFLQMQSVCQNCGAQIFSLCNAVEQLQQVEISQVSKLENIHTSLREEWTFWPLSQERNSIGI